MSEKHQVHVEFPARILFVGFGSIGQGVLPLVLRHIGIAPERITIVTADDRGHEEAATLRAGNTRAPTAVLTHGANPGMVSHFVKQALLNIARDTDVAAGNPG